MSNAAAESSMAARPRVTGIGSLPLHLGFPIGERQFSAKEFHARAVQMASELPYLAEAPGRGVGADMIGRTLAMAAGETRELSAGITPSGWRRSAPGRDLEIAAAYLAEDLDAFCAALAGFTGAVKLQAVGPLTLAACIEGASGERMLGDRSFIRDLPEMLAASVATVVAAITRQSSASQVIVQFDEPMLPMVLGGAVPTASGLQRHRPLPSAEAMDVLQRLVTSLSQPVWLHCCADALALDVLCGVGAAAISVDSRAVDSRALTDAHLDRLGEHIDAGGEIALGVIHPSQWQLTQHQQAAAAVAAAEKLRARLGFAEDQWLRRLLLTPSCGLAGATAGQAQSVMAALDSACASLAGGTISADEA